MTVDYYLQNTSRYSTDKGRLIIEMDKKVIYDGKFEDLPIILFFKIRNMRVSFETSSSSYEKIDIR